MSKLYFYLAVLLISCGQQNIIKSTPPIVQDTITIQNTTKNPDPIPTITIYTFKETNFEVRIPKTFEMDSELINQTKVLKTGNVKNVNSGIFGPELKGYGLYLHILEDSKCVISYVGEGGETGGGYYKVVNGFLVIDCIGKFNTKMKFVFDELIEDRNFLHKKGFKDVLSNEILFDYSEIAKNGTEFKIDNNTVIVDYKENLILNNTTFYLKPNKNFEIFWEDGKQFSNEDDKITQIGFLQNRPNWKLVTYVVHYYGNLKSNSNPVQLEKDSVLLSWMNTD